MITTVEDNSRLTSNSILLQGTWSNSIGKTVALDISAVENYSIFPGQVMRSFIVSSYGRQNYKISGNNVITRDVPAPKFLPKY